VAAHPELGEAHATSLIGRFHGALSGG